jgi:exosortase
MAAHSEISPGNVATLEGHTPSLPGAWVIGALVLAPLVALLYYQVLIKLVGDWWELPDFSHGFLIPPFAAYLVWQKRRSLRDLPLNPQWVGIAVVAFAMLILVVGIFGAELFLSRMSLLILLVGITASFAGWRHVRMLGFVFFVLLLAIPIPAILFNRITLPLQTVASKAASALLPLFGIPVLREGNIIQLPAMQLEVAQACSGIRSLLTLFVVSLLYGYFLERSAGRRVFLAAASVPIAIGANALRILGTGICVQYWSPDRAEGFFHLFSGWIMFVFSLVCLYLVQRTMSLWTHRRPFL